MSQGPVFTNLMSRLPILGELRSPGECQMLQVSSGYRHQAAAHHLPFACGFQPHLLILRRYRLTKFRTRQTQKPFNRTGLPKHHA